MKTPALLILFTVLSTGAYAQESGYFQNPVIRGDVADPSVIRIGDSYYATGTSSEWAPFYPVFKSKDLVNWTQTGHVFDERPLWTSHSFWAPELFVHKGTVYCYYTARRKTDNVSYIGVATSKSPERAFTDHGPIIEYGTEAIDAFVFDDGGQLYISWKAYGLDQRPIELLGCKLSDDGFRLDGEPFTLLTDDRNLGMEGQYHFKKGDYYYIVYSALGCCGPQSDYDVRVARSKNFSGPYKKYEGSPILHGGAGDYQSVGHGTAVETPDGRMFYMCHAYLSGDGFFAGRQPILQEMFVNDDGWVEFRSGRLAVAKQPVPFAGTVQKPDVAFEDNFRKPKPRVEWTWNYPYSDIKAVTGKGRLSLSGTTKPGNRNGTVMCLRPQSPDYSFETRVINENAGMKGLTMYGDDRNLVVWGVQGGKLSIRVVDDGHETVVWESDHGSGTPYFRIKVENGTRLSFYYSANGTEWVQPYGETVDRRNLVRWDRVARPGVIHKGSADEPAEFSYFRMAGE